MYKWFNELDDFNTCVNDEAQLNSQETMSDDDEEGTIKKMFLRTIRGNKELEVKNFSKTMTKKEKHLVKPPLSGVGKKARKKAGLGHMEGHGKKK